MNQMNQQMKGIDLSALPENAPPELHAALQIAKGSITAAENKKRELNAATKKAKSDATHYNNLVLEYRGQLKLFEVGP